MNLIHEHRRNVLHIGDQIPALHMRCTLSVLQYTTEGISQDWVNGMNLVVVACSTGSTEVTRIASPARDVTHARTRGEFGTPTPAAWMWTHVACCRPDTTEEARI